MQIKKFRLNRISRNDMEWLRKRLNKVYKKFNLKLEPEYPLALGAADDSLLLTR
jgi:hypothetical protein